MSISCIRPEDFGTVATLADDHPIRAHLAVCPRCQACWKTYRAFLEDVESPPGSRQEFEADTVLDGVIRKQFGFPEVGRTPRRNLFPAGWWSPFTGRWRIRILILAPSTAAVAVLILLLATTHRTERPEPAFRGIESSASLRLESAQALPDGRIRLTWNAMAGADAYRICVLDTELSPVRESVVPADTTTVIAPSELGAAARSGSRFVWRVSALREGEEIGVSGVGTLRIP